MRRDCSTERRGFHLRPYPTLLTEQLQKSLLEASEYRLQCGKWICEIACALRGNRCRSDCVIDHLLYCAGWTDARKLPLVPTNDCRHGRAAARRSDVCGCRRIGAGAVGSAIFIRSGTGGVGLLQGAGSRIGCTPTDGERLTRGRRVGALCEGRTNG